MKRVHLLERSLCDVALRVSVRQAREERGLSQADLAKLANVSARTVQAYEYGSTGIPPELQRIAEALGVEVHALCMPQAGDESLLTEWRNGK